MPKERARCSGWASAAIMASRGAVRIPLPILSPVTMPATDSDDMSVIMLTTPSQMITGDNRKAGRTEAEPAPAWSCWPPLRSEIEV